MNSTETMRREHRRVAATSWLDTNENDVPPLKPTRTVNDIGNHSKYTKNIYLFQIYFKIWTFEDCEAFGPLAC